MSDDNLLKAFMFIIEPGKTTETNIRQEERLSTEEYMQVLGELFFYLKKNLGDNVPLVCHSSTAVGLLAYDRGRPLNGKPVLDRVPGDIDILTSRDGLIPIERAYADLNKDSQLQIKLEKKEVDGSNKFIKTKRDQRGLGTERHINLSATIMFKGKTIELDIWTGIGEEKIGTQDNRESLTGIQYPEDRMFLPIKVGGNIGEKVEIPLFTIEKLIKYYEHVLKFQEAGINPPKGGREEAIKKLDELRAIEAQGIQA